MSEIMNRIWQSVWLDSLTTGIHMEIADVNHLPQMDIIHLQSRIDHFGVRLEDLEKRVIKADGIKIKEFQDNDVYEVNKRIERLEAKIALLQSNKSKQERSFIFFILLFIAINNAILGSLWWLYG